MADQHSHWNSRHKEGKVDHYSDELSSFGKVMASVLKPGDSILELGCGVGNDSSGFAKLGFSVLATDFSENAITKAAERFQNQENLVFEVLDISQPFPYSSGKFSAVYARLSLHYFSDEVTKKVFAEIKRVLKPQGILGFVCKSTDDPLFGKGEQIEKNMFNLNGHVRHFFDEDYVKECLGENYTVEQIVSGKETFYNEESAFVNVIARVASI